MEYIEGALKQILDSSLDITGQLNPDGGIYTNAIMEGKHHPSIMMQVIQVTPTNVKLPPGAPPKGPDIYRISIMAFDKSLSTAKQIMAEVRNVLNGYQGTIGTLTMRIWKDGQEGLREDQIGPQGLHGEAHDYLIRHQY